MQINPSARKIMQSFLLEQLNQFGLNPTEWRLIKTKNNQFQIENKNDPGFCFWGWTEKNQGWAKLQLVSI